uniref:Uncharacterized protein n=1 Tax=uncultured marine virus TaxID=186617 RepID=A0A0F7L4K0_9VIRU|nr:hypothetical protein [uncultured marine virus]
MKARYRIDSPNSNSKTSIFVLLSFNYFHYPTTSQSSSSPSSPNSVIYCRSGEL